jgi:hypothetical protein
MTEIRKNEIITELAEALQNRDYETFTGYFEEHSVLELPFMVNGGVTFKGLSEIKKHFEDLAADPLEKLIQIREIMTKSYHSEEFVTVEFFAKARSVNSGGTFHIQSSIALIRFGESGIVYYKDIPNTSGMAKKANALEQLAASWDSKEE